MGYYDPSGYCGEAKENAFNSNKEPFVMDLQLFAKKSKAKINSEISEEILEAGIDTVPPEKLLGIKHANLGNPREYLNEKVYITKHLRNKNPNIKPRTLLTEEKRMANQAINDLNLALNGDASALKKLEDADGIYRSHMLDDRSISGGENFAGWRSLDISGGYNNIMRLIYREVDNIIEYRIIQQH